MVYIYSITMRKRAKSKIVLIMVLSAALVSLAPASILDLLSKARDVTAERIEEWGLSMKPAMWQKQLAGGGVQCRLCPFKCVLSEGDRGICGVRAVVRDTLRAMTYARPAAVNLDPIEKKPLYHFTPRSKALSIATVGCNLSCSFCQNWSLSQTLPEKGKHSYLPPAEVVALADKHGASSIAYTYSEPTIFYEYMLETAKLAREAGIENLWITCGFIEPDPLRELCKYMDAANVDLKGWSEDFYSEYTGAMRDPVLRTLRILHEEGVWIEVTNLLIPGANDDPEEIRSLCRWIADSLGTATPLHFSRFHPNYKLTDRPATPVKTLETAREIALAEGLKYVYIGNVRGNDYEDTFCPSCGRKIIDRTGYLIEDYRIWGGKCTFCGAPVDGVFHREN